MTSQWSTPFGRAQSDRLVDVTSELREHSERCVRHKQTTPIIWGLLVGLSGGIVEDGSESLGGMNLEGRRRLRSAEWSRNTEVRRIFFLSLIWRDVRYQPLVHHLYDVNCLPRNTDDTPKVHTPPKCSLYLRDFCLIFQLAGDEAELLSCRSADAAAQRRSKEIS